MSFSQWLNGLKSRAPCRGFTLIELLVVIAITAILSAILFPVFAQARDTARKASTRSNLAQIDAAMRVYREENGVFPTAKQLAQSGDVEFVFFDGQHLLDKRRDFRYAIESVDETTASFTICAIPIPPYHSGSFVICVRVTGETREFFEEDPDEEAVAEEEARWRLATTLALDTSARLLVKKPEAAGGLRTLLAMPETKAFALNLVDRNGDEFVTKEETAAFLTPADGDPAEIAEMKKGLRDIFLVLRLDEGDYEGARLADLKGDAASLYSPENWRLYHHSLIKQPGIAASLSAKVDAAALACGRLEKPAARDACAEIIKAYRNELGAQVLRTIELDAALKLDALIGIECPDEGPF